MGLCVCVDLKYGHVSVCLEGAVTEVTLGGEKEINVDVNYSQVKSRCHQVYFFSSVTCLI